MLSGINIQDLALIITKPFFNYGIGYFYAEKHKKQFTKVCSQELSKINDCSSLDSDDFFKFIKSSTFQELLSSYYIVLNNPNTKAGSYVQSAIELCKQKAPYVKENEFRKFLKAIDSIIQKNRFDVLNKDETLFHIMTLIVQSNNIICDYFSNELKTLNNFNNKDKSLRTFTDYNAILTEHHKNCIAEYNNIKFTGISGAESRRTYKLTDLYVPSNFYLLLSDEFVTTNKIPTEEATKIREFKISYKNLFKVSNRLVILGGAGYGKSTFLDYIFCNYEKLFESNDLLKIKLDLKDISKQIENDIDIESSIFKEISKRVNKLQFNNELITEFFLKYLDSGKCLIIFDALDEIEMPDKRVKIRDEVNNFCNKYKLNKYIITSREVGYLKNQFDESFLHVKISPFSEKQMKQYSKKWFKLQKGTKDKVIKYIVESFMLEVNQARCLDLISNPIMLVLSLIVFKIENRLPHAKIDFYKKCITTFLTEREERKGAYNIEHIADIYHNNLVMPRIAYYKNENEKNNSNYKFSKEEIIRLTLLAIEVPEQEKSKWMSEVSKYTNYIVERTELVKEIDEDRYDFSHKSFKEYFLAVYYAKCLPCNDLINFVLDSIGDANNHELAILIIQYLGKECIIEPFNAIIEVIVHKIEDYKDIYRSSIKESNYFNILVSLFSDNALPIKYNDNFFSLFFSHPLFVSQEIPYSIFNMEIFRKRFNDKFENLSLEEQFRIIWIYTDICYEMFEVILKQNELLYLYYRLIRNLYFYKSENNNDENVLLHIINNYNHLISTSSMLYTSIIYCCSHIHLDKKKKSNILYTVLNLLPTVKNQNTFNIIKYRHFRVLADVAINSAEDFAAFFSVLPGSIYEYQHVISIFCSDYLKLSSKRSNSTQNIDSQILKIRYTIMKSVIEVITKNIDYKSFIYTLRNCNLYKLEFEYFYSKTFDLIQDNKNSNINSVN